MKNSIIRVCYNKTYTGIFVLVYNTIIILYISNGWLMTYTTKGIIFLVENSLYLYMKVKPLRKLQDQLSAAWHNSNRLNYSHTTQILKPFVYKMDTFYFCKFSLLSYLCKDARRSQQCGNKIQNCDALGKRFVLQRSCPRSWLFGEYQIFIYNALFSSIFSSCLTCVLQKFYNFIWTYVYVITQNVVDYNDFIMSNT